MIIFSFVAIEFLIASCCCYRDIKLLCRDIVLLSYTAESELHVATNFKNVVTYFLPCSLSLAELFVATLKSLSPPNCLDLSHCSSIFFATDIFPFASLYIAT